MNYSAVSYISFLKLVTARDGVIHTLACFDGVLLLFFFFAGARKSDLCIYQSRLHPPHFKVKIEVN